MSSVVKINPSLREKLKRIPVIALDAAADEMEVQASEIVAAMKQEVPVQYGDLLNSIGWTWGDVPKGFLVVDEVRDGRNAGQEFLTLKITIYASDEAARFIEFGTAPHRQPELKRDHPGTKANPFFYPVWDSKKRAAIAKVRAAVRNKLKEAYKNG